MEVEKRDGRVTIRETTDAVPLYQKTYNSTTDRITRSNTIKQTQEICI